MKIDTALGKTVWRLLKMLKSEIPHDAAPDFWLYIQRNLGKDLAETAALPCSLQRYSQQPGRGNDLRSLIHYRQMSGTQTQC